MESRSVLTQKETSPKFIYTLCGGNSKGVFDFHPGDAGNPNEEEVRKRLEGLGYID